jgi:hypothetical protein
LTRLIRSLALMMVIKNLGVTVVPLMGRPLCIYEMTKEADPVALARSRMLPTPLGRAYALTRARNAVDTRMLRQGRSRGSSRCSPPARW